MSTLQQLASFYESAPTEANWAGRGYRKLLARYYRHLIPADASILEVGCGSGELLALLPNRDVCGIDLSERQIARARQRLPHGVFHVQAGETLELDRTFDVIVLSETLNQAVDVQALFTRMHRFATPRTRLIVNFFNGLWRPALGLAEALRLIAPAPPSNWLSHTDVANLFDLADWQVLRRDWRILCPAPIPGLDAFLNRCAFCLLPSFCLTVFCVARRRPPLGPPGETKPLMSIVTPARNEAGNIEAAVQRTPATGAELIFVEGGSSDNTWDEIQRVRAKYPERKIKALRQTGKGKGDAVRAGFAAADGEILIILDADLTVPPEELDKFYGVLVSGHAEFANGVRLVYPIEEHAMKLLNFFANKGFSLIFSWLLGQPVKDTLCGTKAFRRADYERIAAQRAYFGDFDPFGDFDLLFGAAKLNLKIADIPIRYRDRTYGATNIQRWRHGWILLRMVVFAARKLKFI